MMKIHFTNSFGEVLDKVEKGAVVEIKQKHHKHIDPKTEKVKEEVTFELVVKNKHNEIVVGTYHAYFETLWVKQNLEFAIERAGK